MPLTLFGRVKKEEQGVDIKKGAIFPLVHGIRALALKYGVRQSNTFKRMPGLVRCGAIRKTGTNRKRLRCSVNIVCSHLRQLGANKEANQVNNYIEPHRLNRLERDLLRSLARGQRVQRLVSARATHTGIAWSLKHSKQWEHVLRSRERLEPLLAPYHLMRISLIRETGLDPNTDDLLTVAAVKIRDGKIMTSEKLDLCLPPSPKQAADSIRIHGIRKVDLEDCIPFSEALQSYSISSK